MAIAPSTFEMTQHSRLGVAHLLLWTCGVAAGLRWYLALLPDDLQLLPEWWVARLGYVYTSVMGFVFGTFLAGTAVIAYHRYRHSQRNPRLPGHWLLLLGFAAVLAAGTTIVCDVVMWSSSPKPAPSASTYWCQFSTGWAPAGPALKHQTIAWGLGSIAALGFLLTVRGQLSRSWVGAFAVFFASSLILFGGYLVALLRHMGLDSGGSWLWLWWWYLVWCRRCGEIYTTLVLACAAGILGAIVHDCRRRVQSDWLHWAGIGACLVVAAMQIATFTVIAFHS